MWVTCTWVGSYIANILCGNNRFSFQKIYRVATSGIHKWKCLTEIDTKGDTDKNHI